MSEGSYSRWLWALIRKSYTASQQQRSSDMIRAVGIDGRRWDRNSALHSSESNAEHEQLRVHYIAEPRPSTHYSRLGLTSAAQRQLQIETDYRLEIGMFHYKTNRFHQMLPSGAADTE